MPRRVGRPRPHARRVCGGRGGAKRRRLVDHLERFGNPKPNGVVFIGPKGGRLRRSNFLKFWYRARGERSAYQNFIFTI